MTLQLNHRGHRGTQRIRRGKAPPKAESHPREASMDSNDCPRDSEMIFGRELLLGHELFLLGDTKANKKKATTCMVEDMPNTPRPRLGMASILLRQFLRFSIPVLSRERLAWRYTNSASVRVRAVIETSARKMQRLKYNSSLSYIRYVRLMLLLSFSLLARLALIILRSDVQCL